jgi:hypothetical protein
VSHIKWSTSVMPARIWVFGAVEALTRLAGLRTGTV